MTVLKTLKTYRRLGALYVQTIEYAYNLSLIGVGNIFRYDNMHGHYGHLGSHHKHEYEPPDQLTQVIEIKEENWPTLGEALNEARNYIHWKDIFGSG